MICCDCKFKDLCSTRQYFLSSVGMNHAKEIVNTLEEYGKVVEGLNKLLAENCACFVEDVK